MKLEVVRRWRYPGATIGELYVEGNRNCFTLEDAVREVPTRPVSEWKIPGKTAIPVGTYTVSVTPSARFKRLMPLLHNVPGFQGVRIHAGNTAEDTEGCILVGDRVHGATIQASRIAFARVFELLLGAQVIEEPITLSIRNGFAETP